MKPVQTLREVLGVMLQRSYISHAIRRTRKEYSARKRVAAAAAAAVAAAAAGRRRDAAARAAAGYAAFSRAYF